jgi:quinol monooxygenase YgiN
MYGLIGKITAAPGQRDALATILLDGTDAMPGCLSYVIARDPTDDNALWITEVWDSADSHKASLSLPAVQAAIAKGPADDCWLQQSSRDRASRWSRIAGLMPRPATTTATSRWGRS